MKAIVKEKSSLKLQSRAKPLLEQNQNVIIKVAICGLCRTDMYVAQGLLSTQESIIPGHEFSGVVEAVSADVRHVNLGDKVAVFPFFQQNNQQVALGVDVDGAFAEFIKVPASIVYKVPENLSFKEAAYLEPLAASLAVLDMPIHPKDKGLIFGDNRIATLTKYLLENHGFDGVDIADLAQYPQLKHNSYDYIIETLANEHTIAAIINLIKPKGILILKSRPHQGIPFPVAQIVKKEIKILPAYYGNFQTCIDLLASKKIDILSLLGETYSFEEAVDILQGKNQVNDNKKIFFKP